MFAPVERPRLYEIIATQIEDLIVSQSLRPGDALPPERELAQRLRVGRPVLRESLGVLAQRGLVKVVPGRGTFVCQPANGFLHDGLRLMLRFHRASRVELCDARELLEVELAGRAALNAGPEDLEAMERAVEAMDAAREDPPQHVKWDLEFHTCIARAAHHTVLGMILGSLHDFLQESVGYESDRPEHFPDFQAGHRGLLEAIRARDAATARQVMHEALQQVRRVAAELDRRASSVDHNGSSSPATFSLGK